jgi:hypothetical protein
MDPSVESALISGVATLVAVGGTVAVAIVGFRSSRQANQVTIDAAHDDVRRTLDVTRREQVSDRYLRAVEQLGSDVLEVRIGAIYALERVTADSARDQPIVMAVLSAFIRERSRAMANPRAQHFACAGGRIPPPRRSGGPDGHRAQERGGRPGEIDLTAAVPPAPSCSKRI